MRAGGGLPSHGASRSWREVGQLHPSRSLQGARPATCGLTLQPLEPRDWDVVCARHSARGTSPAAPTNSPPICPETSASPGRLAVVSVMGSPVRFYSLTF